MVDESVTPVVTAGVQDTYDRLWYNYDEEGDQRLHRVQYEGREAPMSETAIDKDGNAYMIDYSYKNWETPVDLEKHMEIVTEDPIINGIYNPIVNEHMES